MKVLNWSQAIDECARSGRGYVIATIINTQGSAPRDGGSKMVIDAEEIYDTVGGGQLEFLIIHRARELLADNIQCQRLEPFPLAAEAAQCCGGNVTVMFECFPGCDWRIVLFGAGHVSQALMAVLGGLPCQVTVVDSRPEMEPEAPAPNLEFRLESDPVRAVEGLPNNAWIVVFTHEHSLDFRLCCALLSSYRWSFTGLIGSDTKAERFRARLGAEGFDAATVQRIVCPIGLPRVRGKRPMEVAVSIAAQLQSLYYERQTSEEQRSTSWREIKALLRQASTETASTQQKGSDS